MPKPRTAEVVIPTGDYLDRIRLLERKHAAAQDAYEAALAAYADATEDDEKAAPIRRMGQPSAAHPLKERADQLAVEVDRLAQEHDALVEEMETHATRVRVTTVRRRQYRELADAHPPREGEKGDTALGVNVMTFREALVPAAIVEVTEDGETKAWENYTADERDEFLDTLAEADMERLFGTAYGLVNGFNADPKLLTSRSSQPTPESAAS